MLEHIPEDLLLSLLDNPYESTILVDADGIIRFMSSSNEGVYPVSVHEAVGRHISEVSPKTRLTRVLMTGKAEIGRSMILDRKNRVIARIPLTKDGRVIGALGKMMFRSPEKLMELYNRIEALEKDIDFYKNELHQVYGIRYSFKNIIGDSEILRSVKALARQAVETDASVIITGESGTGKELFAHSIHQAGSRSKQNFVRVNCAAIPADLIEAELFGYEPGAFTGASKKGKAGKFELADKGTIFLDEIGDMPMNLQVKMMRVLQEKEVERIGARKPKQIDFRVISATNRDIKKMIDKRDFRLDLYYRLNVFHIHLPALREIPDDIQTIFTHFLRQISIAERGEAKTVSPEAVEVMRNYGWPGNIRELRNVAERAMIVSTGNRIEVKNLPFEKGETLAKPVSVRAGSVIPLRDLLEKTERDAIIKALDHTNNNRAEAAKLLEIHRTGLYQKMKKHGIS